MLNMKTYRTSNTQTKVTRNSQLKAKTTFKNLSPLQKRKLLTAVTINDKEA